MAANLADLEARIAALEARTGESEALQPNYLSVDPTTGAIGAIFPGGVQMIEETALAYGPTTALGWLDSGGGGQIREWIAGLFTLSQHYLTLQSQADANDQAALLLISGVNGIAGSASVRLGAQDSTGVQVAVTGLDSLGRSSFLQLQNLANIKLLWGTVAANGTIIHGGSGDWSVVRTSLGNYTVTLTHAPPNFPIPTITPLETGSVVTATATPASNTTFVVSTFSNTGAAADESFNFLAIAM